MAKMRLNINDVQVAVHWTQIKDVQLLGKIHSAYKPPKLSTGILLREQNLYLEVARNRKYYD